eukprot:a174750_146.p1 GENE.a174750_146~~a174750_146.p1  ORF type:complete len:309 (-),score=86.66 a174750_146:259-1161(-)
MADTGSSTLSAQAFKVLLPEEYHARFLDRAVRADGRSLNAFRATKLQTGVVSTAAGSAVAKVGATTVIVGVSAEVATPFGAPPPQFEVDLDDDSGTGKPPPPPPPPQQGYVIVNADLPPLCSPAYQAGRPSNATQLLTKRLTDLLDRHNVIDKKALVIAPGQAAWVLYIDAVCIDDDGNVFDAALLAVMAALRSTTLPAATVSPSGEVQVEPTEPRSRLPLGAISLFPASFARLASHMIADPTAAELRLASGEVSLVVSLNGELLDVELGGAVAVEQTALAACVQDAGARARALAREHAL